MQTEEGAGREANHAVFLVFVCVRTRVRLIFVSRGTPYSYHHPCQVASKLLRRVCVCVPASLPLPFPLHSCFQPGIIEPYYPIHPFPDKRKARGETVRGLVAESRCEEQAAALY